MFLFVETVSIDRNKDTALIGASQGDLKKK
jgi:hypothetical protein